MTRYIAIAAIVTATPLAAQPPAGGILNSTDTVSVARLADGSCDWRTMKVIPGKPGTSTWPGPTDVKTCTAIHYNVTFPVNAQPMRADTATAIPPRRQQSDAARVVSASDSAAIRTAARTLVPKADNVSVTDRVTIQVDTAWATVWVSEFSGRIFRVERRDGTWVPRKDVFSIIVR